MTDQDKKVPNMDSQKNSPPAVRSTPTQLLAPIPGVRGSTRQKLRFLSHSVQLEEAGPPRFLSTMILVAGLLVVGGVAWAGVTKVTSSARSSGTVVPSGAIYAVKHLEGGIVSDVLIQNGDHVEAGALLLRLDDAASGADLDQLESRRLSLMAKGLRLRAELDGAAESFEALGSTNPALISDQTRLLSAARQSYDDEKSILESRVEQRRLEAESLREQVSSFSDQLAALQEQLEIREKLFEKGNGSRLVLLDTKREVARLRGSREEARFGLRQAESSIIEARSSVREHDSRWRNERAQELETVTAELAEVSESLILFKDRVARLEIRAPVRGIVNLLTVAGSGTVIAPGENLMEIVPSDERLLVEVKVEARDVGFLTPGQTADVSVSGFDVSRYGTLPGRLEWVSATSNSDEQGRIFYAARVALEATELNYAQDRRQLMSGMAVQASITTGSQSLLSFMIRPVAASLRLAFAER
jgi:adhesin transport system membrane fusion protein